jgi:2'-5' RNA ligase
MRLFTAVQPPAEVLDHLDNALVVVRAGRTNGLRWTPPTDRHITLAFFGEVPDGYREEVADALDDVAAAHVAFDAALRGAGLFDGRTLWVGCSGEGWGPLMSDAGRVGSELLGRAEDRRSRPHLTVARAGGRLSQRGDRRGNRRRDRRGDRNGHGRLAADQSSPAPSVGAEPAALAHALALYSGPAWTVADIVLVRSRIGAGPGGSPAYDVVHRSVLRAVAG